MERRRRKIKERGWKMRTKREEGVGEKREEMKREGGEEEKMERGARK